MINGKVIYTPKGAALEYGRIGCNFYTGCPHNCEYCYLKRGAPSKQLGGTDVKLKRTLGTREKAYTIFMDEVSKNLEQCQRDGLFLSFTTDPLIEETRLLTLDAILFCNQVNVPVCVLTKCGDFSTDYRFMTELSSIPGWRRPNIHFGFTLTGRDDMEPNASSNNDRIVAMRRMKSCGFSTFASIEPVIDWDSSERVIRDSIDCCDHYKIGLRSGVKHDYYDHNTLAERVTKLVDFITEHGKTVYLKISVRSAFSFATCCSIAKYNALMRKTVDMDGNPISK